MLSTIHRKSKFYSLYPNANCQSEYLPDKRLLCGIFSQLVQCCSIAFSRNNLYSIIDLLT